MADNVAAIKLCLLALFTINGILNVCVVGVTNLNIKHTRLEWMLYEYRRERKNKYE